MTATQVARATSTDQLATIPMTVPMTRREFLYYIWAASMALITAESVGAIIWFAIPRFRAGEFGGKFTIKLDQLPALDSGPAEYADGRFWLVNLSEQGANDPRTLPGYATAAGVVAHYKVCVHLGCLYKWVLTNSRFECPCHGSKYLLNGVRFDGPARRNLDRLLLQFVDAAGQVLAATKTGDTDGDPTVGLPIPVPANAAAIIVDTSKRILGERNPR